MIVLRSVNMNVNAWISLIGILSSFALFLDSIDLMLDKGADKIYKIVRILCIWFNILAMYRFYIMYC